MKKIILAICLAVGSLGLYVSPSSAATPPKQVCKTLTGSVTITPGLSTTPKAQSATAKGNLGTCAPKTKTGGTGVMTATLKLPANSSCQGLASGNSTIKAKSKITWKNKKVSNVTFTAKTGTGSKATVATITGKVASGLFAGRPIAGAIKFTPKAGQNCTPGHPIKNLTFKQTKPFVVK